MNINNLVKQCELVLKLSNGKSNPEISFVYNTAKSMVENGMGKMNNLVIRETPDNIKLADVCAMMHNLRMWHFCVIGDIATMYKWQEVARISEIVKVGDEFAVKFHS